MRALSIELEDELVDTLEAERERFGFESRQAYVRWIIEHRGSITAESNETTASLEAARDRIATLEQRLAVATDREPTAASETQPGDDRCSLDPDTQTPSSAHADCGVDQAPTTGADDAPQAASSESRTDGDGWTRPKSDPSVEVRGSPRTTISSEGTPSGSATKTDGERADSPTAVDESGRDSSKEPSAAREKSEPTQDSSPGMHVPQLSPERIVRIPGDPVSEDADVLETVEFDRVDELSRRAVATTRKRLNREVQTGLEYASSTRLPGNGVQPGEDLADLEALSLPGRSTETVEKRRHAVGRALAYVRDERRARRSDFVDALYTECPAGYETADGWWRCIKAGLKQVDCVDGGDGTRVWRYEG
ncbi:hypothetical protein [Natronorubrum thiooxidans]|uniref:Ribbon-helix-helix protein, copG family n=1 Tax=Natronorubrum thiooxidans TaxID=308853 RepID=A0A1N7EEP7_9EURY|nr:hypothetical protein [Natronorubrum thiooxidans]SIR86571.1 hypothetical protein SAMN05421752_10423 [Natronorubrum thiooxidans]